MLRICENIFNDIIEAKSGLKNNRFDIEGLWKNNWW